MLLFALLRSTTGLLLALGFVVVIGGVLLWMFRLPRPVTPEVARARRSLDAARLVLVPTNGTEYAERAIELACRLALEQEAAILLVHVIEVPRTLPLGAPLPEAERHAAEVLTRACDIVSLHNLQSKAIVQRARDAGSGVLAAARDERADLIVMGLKSHYHSGLLWGHTPEVLLHRAPCEVIFDKTPAPPPA